MIDILVLQDLPHKCSVLLVITVHLHLQVFLNVCWVIIVLLVQFNGINVTEDHTAPIQHSSTLVRLVHIVPQVQLLQLLVCLVSYVSLVLSLVLPVQLDPSVQLHQQVRFACQETAALNLQ